MLPILRVMVPIIVVTGGANNNSDGVNNSGGDCDDGTGNDSDAISRNSSNSYSVENGYDSDDGSANFSADGQHDNILSKSCQAQHALDTKFLIRGFKTWLNSEKSVPHDSVSRLLTILKPNFSDLPASAKSLMNDKDNFQIVPMNGGELFISMIGLQI